MSIVKKFAILIAFLCVATVANEEGAKKIGGKLSYFAVQPTGDGAKDADMSFLGLSVGIVMQIPLDVVSVNPGVELYYSKTFSMINDLGRFGKTENSINELGISIPVIVQYDISEAYVGGGLQANLPFSSKTIVETTGTPGGNGNGKVESDTPDRATLDLGLAIVAGYNISENISVGAKAVIGLTDTDEDSKVSYNQYGISVIYFF